MFANHVGSQRSFCMRKYFLCCFGMVGSGSIASRSSCFPFGSASFPRWDCMYCSTCSVIVSSCLWLAFSTRLFFASSSRSACCSCGGLLYRCSVSMMFLCNVNKYINIFTPFK